MHRNNYYIQRAKIKGVQFILSFYRTLTPLVRERGRKIFDFSGVSVDLTKRKRQTELHPIKAKGYDRILLPVLITLFGYIFSYSQVIPLADIEFLDKSGNTIVSAFAGGLRAPQFNKIDLNFDGLDDLVVFDRAGDLITPFISQAPNSIDYKYEPKWALGFPKIQEWMILADYDGDGIMDIFCFPTTAAIPGVEVWKGRNDNGQVAFDLVTHPDEEFDILFVPVANGRTQVYVSVVDIPVVKDIDKDGDIDILSFDPTGSTVFFYENRGAEDFGDPSILDFRLEDNCFGRFVESGFSQDVILSVDGVGCANSFGGGHILTTRHAGSTIETFDHNGDGLMDLLLGDISYNGINLLENGGTDRPWMTSSIFGFPTNEPTKIELFLTPKSIDIDNDGIDEIIISSNDVLTSQTIDNVWLFENESLEGFTGRLTTKNFLSDRMIDHGEFSLPVFTDYNQDGLIDLVVGTSGKFINTSEKEPSLMLYENIGTTTSPRYQLVEEDYLGFNQFKSTSSFFAPSFGDLDGDGDFDLLVGDDRGRLYFSENIAGAGEIYDYGPIEYQYQDIQVSSFARPCIVDLNLDGLGDIILGERNFNSTSEIPVASINYFQNIGLSGSPLFDKNVNSFPNSAALGGINLKQDGFINNNSAISVWQNSGEFIMITGSEAGDLKVFNIPIDDIYSIYEEDISSNINSIDVGVKSAPALYDIDKDNLLELAVGNFNGGLTIIDTDLINDFIVGTKEESLSLEFDLYPNPAHDIIHISISKKLQTYNPKIFIFNELGTKIHEGKGDKIDVRHFSSGVYFMRITTGAYSGIKYFIKF